MVAGYVPPSFKELIKASVRVAPPNFYEEMQRLSPSKLMKRLLEDLLLYYYFYLFSISLFNWASC